jgi:vitamin K-dependent gamma-carboxylase
MQASRNPTGARTWRRAASTPVDPASLAVLRVALGAVGVLSAVRIAAYGWIDSLYAGPSHRFTYVGFAWVPQPGRAGMTVLVVALGVSSAALALGWHTRLAALGVLAALGWIELVDATTYLNHYWFLTLVAALAMVAPVGRGWSLDARRGGGPTTVARGWIWLLRFQVGVVYAFAGLAKLQRDWLVEALPLRLWLPARDHLALVGPLLAQPATAHVLSVAGAAFDCTIVPLLLWRRTRLPAWCGLVAFHVCTWALFPIGVFPWVMIGASTVFFAPDWPRRLVVRVRPRMAVPRLGRPASPPVRRLAVAGAAVWVVVQLALPVRHLAYPGDHRWTGQGYRFAWNVLLTEKAGTVTFLVRDEVTGRRWVADPSELYTPTQLRVMGAEPDLIHQAAQLIARRERAKGRQVEVRVDAWVSFDGRPPARLIDPTVDLAAQPRGLAPADWILPRP